MRTVTLPSSNSIISPSRSNFMHTLSYNGNANSPSITMLRPTQQIEQDSNPHNTSSNSRHCTHTQSSTQDTVTASNLKAQDTSYPHTPSPIP
ncbi:predicted protein [Plenodomus lingam JN3]|uniref:Predicted protein n=1 Tax=Leptosphaeria maculans (strain JN3 / isolate v23.1.3 / race Av1-4-5-6-7-8) TaxID=985895 RepID=E5A9A3_LEPMJ|nr:predicted protein [Plenodomus lingam JN3]CBY00244.1 predicted protein [Plenodomus lingam JN3]